VTLFDRFVRRLEALVRDARPGTMLYPALLQSYEAGRAPAQRRRGTTTVRASAGGPESCALPSLSDTTAQAFLRHPELSEECSAPRPSSSGAPRARRWTPSRAASTGS
jgi:hypothetical protein